jgi:23S rRNA (uracil1939-C5)-methyltransferase
MKLHIEKVIYGGNGLARVGDSTEREGAVFVPFTLPDETVEVGAIETRNAVREAFVHNVISPSTDRVAPRCDHFGECGGCQYQHANYVAQTGIKRQILAETLERARITSLPAIKTHTGDPWNYRNRIRLRVTKLDGELRVGYLRRGSADFLPVHMCSIAAPLLWKAVEALLALEGDSARWVESADEIELFTNSDESKLLLTLFLRQQPTEAFDQFCEALQAKLPELAGAGVSLTEREARNRKTQRFRAGATWGAEGLNYAVGDESYWISRGGFFQVNRTLLDTLVTLVTKGRHGELAWDLYAGAGLFSRVLAKDFREVVAVEAAASDLTRTFRGQGRRAVGSTTIDFLRRAVLERDRPELIVMDPPRAGVGHEVCALLARLRTAEVVYVSCDPVTLGRDLKQMVDSGYRLNELHMIDMFPQTFHQETIAVLRHMNT